MMLEKALQIHDDIESIKRCIYQTNHVSMNFLLKYFNQLSPEWSYECLTEIFEQNIDENKTFIQIVQKFSKKIGASNIYNLFIFLTVDEIYQLLSNIVYYCDDPDLHFIYIDFLSENEYYDEVEKMCKESIYLDPIKVFDYLVDKDLINKSPLISLSIRFNFIEDLTMFLLRKNYIDEIKYLAKKDDAFNDIGEKVLSVLLKIRGKNNIPLITNIMNLIKNTTPVEKIFPYLLEYDLLNLLNHIIDDPIKSKTTNANIHNAYVIQSVLLQRNAEKIINEDIFYDCKYVGDILSNRAPYYACIAYSKGNYVDEFIDLSNKNKLFILQAFYLIKCASSELWDRVLSKDNVNRHYLVDAVIISFRNIKSVNEIGKIIASFEKAGIESQIIDLLDKLIFRTTFYKNDCYLQTQLINKVAKIDPSRVMFYVKNLNDYSINRVADCLIKEKLYDEVIVVYNKFGQQEKASEIIINYKNKSNLKSIEDCKIESNSPNFDKNLLQKLIGILENKKLNNDQTTELCKYVLSQNKEGLISFWNFQERMPTKMTKIDRSNEDNSMDDRIKFIDSDGMKKMTKIEIIGRGGTSEVFKYTKEKCYAVKTLILGTDPSFSLINEYKRLMNEYLMIKNIKNRFIIKTHGFFSGDEKQPPSIVMSLCSSSLDKKIKLLDNGNKRRIIKEICLGMIDVHSLGIIHLDLKPQNILLTKKDQVRISDFGSSKILQELTLTTSNYEVTLNYIAPEILNHKKINEKVDVYAFGIILYFILTNGTTPKLGLSDIFNGKKPVIPGTINDFSKSLILKCISFDPKDRPSFKEILSLVTTNKLLDENY